MLREILLVPLAFAAAVALAAADAPGCKDHPLASRMGGFHIYGCETVPFQALKVRDAQGKERAAEGKYTSIAYDLDEGRPRPSRVQIIRNYENALRPLGGAVFSQFDDGAETYLRAARDGQVIWLYLNVYNTERYVLQVLEEGAMAQEVVANAAAFSKDIRATGHASVYGIHFDTGKADIRPESEAALKEVAALLSGDPQLRLLVVGHTDGVGSLEANMRLSQMRADPVVKALTARYGVAPARLKPQGAGPIAPVATNRTEEGRAKNRRVELVEQ
jgi:outer membrane protein OmpA-like peptidoglycan-associated protein